MGAQTEIKHRSDLGDHLAAERTFLAWIRTGLALTGFGFVLARFSLILQEIQYTRHIPSARPYEMSPWFGTTLIAVGVAVYIISAWHHIRLVRRLDREGPLPSRPSTQAVAIALFLALVGLAMVIYLVSVGNSGYSNSGNDGKTPVTPAVKNVTVKKTGSQSADRAVVLSLERAAESHDLMMSAKARFVVDQEGVNRSADISPHCTVRQEPGRTVKAVRAIGPDWPHDYLSSIRFDSR